MKTENHSVCASVNSKDSDSAVLPVVLCTGHKVSINTIIQSGIRLTSHAQVPIRDNALNI
jgi:hypothetical protein